MTDSDARTGYEVETALDQVFASPGGRPLMADLYLPRGVLRPLPMVVFLHGGGWRFGDRRLAPDLERFYARSGFAMVSIDYRLSGEAVFPAALEDVKIAVRWLKSVAGQYGLDPDRVALWGSSAGGHLAALAAATGPGLFEGEGYQDQSSAVRAVVDGYGPTDFLQMDAQRDPRGEPSDDPESIQLPKGKRSEDADSLESLFIGAPIRGAPERVAKANPLTYVKPGLPPFLIMHGSSDTAVPFHQSEILFEALARNGADATLAIIEGLGHGFFNRNHLDDVGARMMRVSRTRGDTTIVRATESRRVFELVLEFLSERLGRRFGDRV